MIDALCGGAHPDDVEIGMGGTVAGMLRRGLFVAIVDLTDGEPTPHGSPEVRVREASDAAGVLGLKERTILDLPNRELADTPAAREALAEVIREFRPRLVFGPFPEDAHPDHVAAAQIVDGARFFAKLTKSDMSGDPYYPPRLYQYYAVHLRRSQEPSFLVDVSDDMDAKMDALGRYESQFFANPANRGVLGVIRTHAEYWGSLIGTSHAEPFYSREQIGVSSPTDLL